jgi:signal transduction histidine kinase
MDTADGVRPPESWLLDTLGAVSEAVSDAADSATLGRSVPAALTEPAEHTAAWIGQRSAETISIRASEPAMPDRLTDIEASATGRALDSDSVCLLDASACPEYERLRRTDAVPAATGAVVIPIRSLQDTGVVQLYTDANLSQPAVSETMTQIGELLDGGFTRCEAQRNLDRERERLEQLRSLVSHDLGNPINIAAGRLDLVRTECDSEHIDHVESAIEQVESLADEGLLFVKAGREPNDQSAIELHSLAEDCWTLVDAPETSLTVHPITVYAESERLRMLLNQLFENAVVHTEGATVTVGPLSDDHGFYVADDGPGIPADEQEYVFDRGYTTGSDRDGNGLAVVEEIAGVFGWEVDIADAPGTRIEIRTENW